MSGYVVLTCTFHKEDRSWVGVCDELGTSTFGRTLDDAEEKLQQAIALHLNTLEDVGERERFFEENNIAFYQRKPQRVKLSVETDSNTFVTSCIQPVGELLPV